MVSIICYKKRIWSRAFGHGRAEFASTPRWPIFPGRQQHGLIVVTLPSGLGVVSVIDVIPMAEASYAVSCSRRSSSGSLAMLAAMRRSSSRVSSFAAQMCTIEAWSVPPRSCAVH